MREISSKNFLTNNPAKTIKNRIRMSIHNPMKLPKNIGKFAGKNNPACRPEVRAKISDSTKGKRSGILSPRYGKSPPAGAGRGTRMYIIDPTNKNICLRSTFEYRVAKILNNRCIYWEYENEVLLNNNRIWHPDFYLPQYNIFLEVKGWLTPDAKNKLVEYDSIYHDNKLIIIELSDIIQLENNESILNVGKPVHKYLMENL